MLALPPLVDELHEGLFSVALVAVLEHDRRLRLQDLARVRQDPEVRRAIGFRQPREEGLVAVLVADIHLRDDEYVVQRAIDVVVLLEELVEVVAPNTPIAARDKQYELVLGVRARFGRRERYERIGRRIVADVAARTVSAASSSVGIAAVSESVFTIRFSERFLSRDVVSALDHAAGRGVNGISREG